eukprot:scaffold153444_cov14-Tisochrysis_lutea.AAC.1
MSSSKDRLPTAVPACRRPSGGWHSDWKPPSSASISLELPAADRDRRLLHSKTGDGAATSKGIPAAWKAVPTTMAEADANFLNRWVKGEGSILSLVKPEEGEVSRASSFS